MFSFREIVKCFEYLVVELNYVVYGKKFEKFDVDEWQLVFEDFEIVVVEVEEQYDNWVFFDDGLCCKLVLVRCNCGNFFVDLLWIEWVVEFDSLNCFCGCG